MSVWAMLELLSKPSSANVSLGLIVLTRSMQVQGHCWLGQGDERADEDGGADPVQDVTDADTLPRYEYVVMLLRLLYIQELHSHLPR